MSSPLRETFGTPALKLADARVLVVGASSGIGRAIGLAAAGRGARVAFAARRAEKLSECVAEAGSGAVALSCDVRDPHACARVVAETEEALGGLDVLVYAAGVVHLAPAAEMTTEQWLDTVAINLTGAALVTRHALRALAAAAGRAVYISSDTVLRPRPGLLPYATTKAGLDMMVAGLRGEVPDVSFTRVVVGPTRETDLGSDYMSDRKRFFRRWQEMGFTTTASMSPAQVGEEIAHILESEVDLDDVVLEPRCPR